MGCGARRAHRWLSGMMALCVLLGWLPLPVRAAGLRITALPEGQAADPGETVTFSVTVEGEPAYQWERGVLLDPSADRQSAPADAYEWTAIEGANQPTYRLVCSAEDLSVRAYRCVVADGEERQRTDPVWVWLREPAAAPRNAGAAVLGGNVGDAASLLERLGDCAVLAEGRVQLTRSCTVTGRPLTFVGGEITLDLNGCTLTGQSVSPLALQGGALTVVDSAGGGGVTGGSGMPALSVGSGTLNLRAGVFQGGSAAPAVLAEGGAAVHIQGGSLMGGGASGKGAAGLRVALTGGSCAISGGHLQPGAGKTAGVGLELASDAPVTLTGGTYDGYDGTACGRKLNTLAAAGYGFVRNGQPVDGSQMGETLLYGTFSVERVQHDTVYLDGSAPEGGDGTTPQTAVTTFARARELVAPGGAIQLIGPVTVADSQSWQLPAPGRVILSGGGAVIVTGKLELSQIALQGGQGPTLQVAGGAVVLGSGANVTGNQDADGAAVRVDRGSLTLSGGSISGNHGRGLTLSEGSIILSSGRIADNGAEDVSAAGSVALGGAVTVGRLALDGSAQLTITAPLAGGDIGLAPSQLDSGTLVAQGDGYILRQSDVDALRLDAASKWVLILDTRENAVRLAPPRVSRVYLDGEAKAGGDGSTPEQAVRTFSEARERLARDGEICIVGPVTITQEETWSLPENLYGRARVVRAAAYADGPMVQVAGGRLTLRQVDLDGALAADGAPGILVGPQGDLVIGPKAVLENHAAGAVRNQGRTVITGGAVRGSAGPRGGLDNAGYLRLEYAALTDALYTSAPVILAGGGLPALTLEAGGCLCLAEPLSDTVGIQSIADPAKDRVVVRGESGYAPTEDDLANLSYSSMDWQLALLEGDIRMLPVYCRVTYALTGLTVTGAAANTPYGQPLTVTLTSAEGARLPDQIVVTQDGLPVAHRYDPATGAVTVPSVTGTLVITAKAKIAYPISVRVDGGGTLGMLEEALPGDLVTVVVIADAGSSLAPDSLRVNGQMLTYVAEGVYSFVMPEGGAVLCASFVADAIPTLRITQNLPARRAVQAGDRVRWQITHEAPEAAGWVSYQWFKNGAALPGAQDSSLTLRAVRAEDAGAYHVEITYHLRGQWTRSVSEVCELEVAQEAGQIVLKAEAHPGAPLPQVADMDALADAVLTQEEKSLVERGGRITLRLAVQSLPAGQYGELLERALLPGERLGMVMELQLFKQVDGGAPLTVPQMGGPVRVTLELSDELRLMAQGQPFTLLRVHGDRVERLPNLDAHSRRYTFVTDRFSTYALIYGEAEPVTTPSRTPEPTPMPPSETPAEPTTGAVPTGAGSLVPAALLMALSAGGLSALLRRRQSR